MGKAPVLLKKDPALKSQPKSRLIKQLEIHNKNEKYNELKMVGIENKIDGL